jgi:ComF family protein
MKNPSGEALALAAGRLLARRIRDQQWQDQPEIVVPTPMHWTRRMWRGVNAPAIIAESLAQELALPCVPDLLRVVRNVAKQATLTPSRRRRNMRGAFQSSQSYSFVDRHILLIDDVLTTGATANALAQPLLRSGAKSVSVAVIARGIGKM